MMHGGVRMKILVTGGAGYIGSHTCVSLIESGHNVVVADNLSNSKVEVMDSIEKITGTKIKFYQIDVTAEEQLKKVFDENDFDGVIHFAGFKAVGESVEKPLEYYYNNVVSTILLSKMCTFYGVNKLVFSSSATVYGENKVPFVETMQLLPTTNPYGETKAISERILKDLTKAYPKMSVTLLRYFNPVGAHISGLIGENPNGIPNNLMPFITQVAKGKLKELKVFGDDYDTLDGTGVRDYIHVVDLAKGHTAALEKSKKGTEVYNLGTGKGTSVLQLIETFERVNGIKIPYSIIGRRTGDIAECYANVNKAENELGWKAELGVEEMVRDAWNFEKKQM
jgi:UDP-glucose 4-epimerase